MQWLKRSSADVKGTVRRELRGSNVASIERSLFKLTTLRFGFSFYTATTWKWCKTIQPKLIWCYKNCGIILNALQIVKSITSNFGIWPTVPDADDRCCWCLLCNIVTWSVGWVCRGGRTSKGWGSCQQTRDKSGWEFATTSKKAGSPSK